MSRVRFDITWIKGEWNITAYVGASPTLLSDCSVYGPIPSLPSRRANHAMIGYTATQAKRFAVKHGIEHEDHYGSGWTIEDHIEGLVDEARSR